MSLLSSVVHVLSSWHCLSDEYWWKIIPWYCLFWRGGAIEWGSHRRNKQLISCSHGNMTLPEPLHMRRQPHQGLRGSDPHPAHQPPAAYIAPKAAARKSKPNGTACSKTTSPLARTQTKWLCSITFMECPWCADVSKKVNYSHTPTQNFRCSLSGPLLKIYTHAYQIYVM